MTIDKLKPGMTVYDVGRHKMGNTTISTVAVWSVKIISVDKHNNLVTASWNGNPERIYASQTWSKWRAKEPKLVRGAFGSYRLAKKGEDAR